jgi:hypothetical protein
LNEFVVSTPFVRFASVILEPGGTFPSIRTHLVTEFMD